MSRTFLFRAVFVLSVITGLFQAENSAYAQDGYFFKRESMLTPRQEGRVSVLNGRIHYITGINVLSQVVNINESYDPATNSWQSETAPNVARHHATLTELNGKFYLIGGYLILNGNWIPLTTVFEYNPLADTWTDKAPMPFPRAEHVAAAVDGKIYVIGGMESVGQNTDLNYAYDPVTDSWELKSFMLQARNHSAVAVIDSLVYVISGRTSSGVNVPVFDAYSPATDTWIALPDIPTARSGLTAGALNGKIYTFGGEGFFPSAITFPDVEMYDPAAGVWIELTDAPRPRHGHDAAVVGDTIFLFGGSFSAGAQGLVEGYVVGECVDFDEDGYGDPGVVTNTCPTDNCPDVFNPDQEDSDGDGIGDLCDICPNDPLNDIDGDGICADLDNCPGISNPDQADANGNGIGNACDVCCILPGDADNSGSVNIADVTFIISRIFSGGASPVCQDQADADGSNSLNIADVTYLIAHIFGGGLPPICGSTGL